MNAVIDTEARPMRVAPHPTHKFKLLLRREFWEHKGGFFWAPLVAGGIFLLLAVMGIGVGEMAKSRIPGDARVNIEGGSFQIDGLDLGHVGRQMSPHDLQELGQGVDVALFMAGSWPLIVLAFVVFFYCLGALYDERKDRSVLFWKSLPISDAQTVLSKLVTALLVGPLIALAITGLVMLATGLMMSIFIAINGGNPFYLYWSHLSPFKLFIGTFGWLPIYVLWALPTAGWLMLCSAWARRMPFLWAVMLPIFAGVAVSMVNGIVDAFGGTRGHVVGEWFWQHIVLRALTGTWPGSHLLGYIGTPHLEQLPGNPDTLWQWDGLTTGLPLLATPQLWIGAVIGIAMIFAATRLRRWRDDA